MPNSDLTLTNGGVGEGLSAEFDRSDPRMREVVCTDRMASVRAAWLSEEYQRLLSLHGLLLHKNRDTT
jgi:hypothetical protein